MNVGIKVISAEGDLKLFTDAEYNGKVQKIVEDLKREYKITGNHAIACYSDHIELYNGKQLELIREVR